MKRAFLVIFLALTFVSLSIFSAGILKLALETEPVGLDPTVVTAFASHRILELVYSSLLTYDKDMNLVPDLAESYEIPDPYTLIFKIRKNVKFHDGSLLTLDDIVFTFKRIMDKKTGSPILSYFKDIESIEKSDDSVIFKFKEPVVMPLLPIFASVNTAIVSKRFVESGENLMLKTNGTGPFILREYISGDRITLVRNKDYYIPGLPKLNEIKIIFMPEEISRITALLTGEVDLAVINNAVSLRSLPESRFKIFRKPVLSYYLLGLNDKRKPFDNPKVRLAISYAIDRESIIKLVSLGEGQVTGPLNPMLKSWALAVKELPGYKRDVNKAKELLKEAGYNKGFNFKVMAAQKYNFDKVAQVIKDQLKEIGINAEIEIVEWGIFVKRWKERDFDSFVSLNSGSIEPDIQFYRTFHTTGSTNVFGYSNPVLDELLEKGKREVNFEKRKEIYDKVQRILAEEVPFIFLYSPNKIYVGQKYVKAFELLSNESLEFLKETYIEK